MRVDSVNILVFSFLNKENNMLPQLVLVAPPLILDVFGVSGQPRRLLAGGRGLPLRLVWIAQIAAIFDYVSVYARVLGPAIGGHPAFAARACSVLPGHEAFDAEGALTTSVVHYLNDWVVDRGFW
jgi:hypothetical protein